MEECRSSFKILVDKSGKRSLGIPMCRLESNIIMDLKENIWNFVDSTHDIDCECGIKPPVAVTIEEIITLRFRLK